MYIHSWPMVSARNAILVNRHLDTTAPPLPLPGCNLDFTRTRAFCQQLTPSTPNACNCSSDGATCAGPCAHMPLAINATSMLATAVLQRCRRILLLTGSCLVHLTRPSTRTHAKYQCALLALPGAIVLRPLISGTSCYGTPTPGSSCQAHLCLPVNSPANLL